MMLLEIRNITKRFGNFVAVDDINLGIKVGEFFTLLGPSCCDKTTLLRMIAGFDANSDTVSSPRIAANATFALNSLEYCLRFLLISLLLLAQCQSLTACTVFGDHFNAGYSVEFGQK